MPKAPSAAKPCRSVQNDSKLFIKFSMSLYVPQMPENMPTFQGYNMWLKFESFANKSLPPKWVVANSVKRKTSVNIIIVHDFSFVNGLCGNYSNNKPLLQ